MTIGRIAGLALALPAAALLATGLRAKGETCVAEYTTSVDGRMPNQVHNAELAAMRLDGAVIQPGKEFSFNRRVGSWTRDAGFRRAPTAYNGTLIDQWGGGVCQASTTLYNAALLAGAEIVERHPHHFAPSYIEPGRDAAVAFSGVDLRFRNTLPFALKLRASVRGGRLHVGLYGAGQIKERPQIVRKVLGRAVPVQISVGKTGERSRVRNSGKAGWQVQVYRVTDGQWETLSKDTYPVMDSIIER